MKRIAFFTHFLTRELNKARIVYGLPKKLSSIPLTQGQLLESLQGSEAWAPRVAWIEQRLHLANADSPQQ